MNAKKSAMIGLLLACSFQVYSNEISDEKALKFVTTASAKFDQQGNLIPPDKYFLRLALKNYEDGFNGVSYGYFKKAAAFGNTVAQKYVGMMNIKALGVERDWAQGYAWIKLAARDKSAEHMKLEQQIKSILKPEELAEAETIYKTIKDDYDEIAALERRDIWVRKQKNQIVGSRVGAETSTIRSYTANGRLVSANSRFDQMENFVTDFNYGYVEQGAIETVESGSEDEN